MRGARPFLALEAECEACAALEPGESVVVAASGGPDSTALAALLVLAAAQCGASVLLAHVDHAVRPRSAQDEAVVLALGATLRVRVATTTLGPGSAAEARLRAERYAALIEIARTAAARRVFAAHHAEDQTEAVLLALFRGAGPAGLRGMAPVRPLAADVALSRPLLGVEPATLRAYCLFRNLPFALDPANADARYRRSALRAALAQLREGFPHLDRSVARYARILREEDAGSPRAELRRALRAGVLAHTGDALDLSFERLDGAARALEDGRAGRHFLRRGVELIVE